jgi:hypothetical protein
MAKAKTTNPTVAIPKSEPDKAASQPESQEAKAGTTAVSTAVTKEEGLPEFLADLPEEIRAKLYKLMKKFSPEKRGMLGDTNKSRFAPVHMRVRQPMTGSAPDTSKVGDFITDDRSLGSEVNLIPLITNTTRTKWPDSQTSSDQVECRSSDGLRGFWQRKEIRECEPCIYRQWNEKLKKFPCQQSLNVICIDDNLTDFYSIPFKGASFKTGSKFAAVLSRHGEICDSVYKFTARKQATNSSFEMLQPSIAREFEEADPLFRVAQFFQEQILAVYAKLREDSAGWMDAAETDAKDASAPASAEAQKAATPDMNM